jgi:ATP-dependent Clp protease protease subunit
MAIRVEQILKHKNSLAKMMADACGQPFEKVLKDVERDFWLDAKEAVKYGIVDSIIKPKSK